MLEAGVGGIGKEAREGWLEKSGKGEKEREEADLVVRVNFNLKPATYKHGKTYLQHTPYLKLSS